MDALDARILRELWSGGSMGLARSDPRMTMGGLARAVGVDRTTVRDRLQRWRQVGFLHGFELIPDPALFGYRMMGGGVRVDDPRQKAAVLESLRLIDGVWNWLDHAGPWIGVGQVAASETMAQQRAHLMARLPGVQEVVPPFPAPFPPSEVPISPLDWRLIQALRRLHEGSLQDVAAALGVSTSTVARRYARLVEAGAVLTMPNLDFTRYEGSTLGRLILYLQGGTDPNPIAARFLRDPGTLVAYPVRAMPSFPGFVDLYLHLPSAAAMEDQVLLGLGFDGVDEAEVLWPRRLDVAPQWFDDRIERAVASTGGSNGAAPKLSEEADPPTPEGGR